MEIKERMEVKELLTTEEAANLLGISKSYLYKLTAFRQIPFYKPLGGRKIVFEKNELLKWATRYRIEPINEIGRINN